MQYPFLIGWRQYDRKSNIIQVHGISIYGDKPINEDEIDSNIKRLGIDEKLLLPKEGDDIKKCYGCTTMVYRVDMFYVYYEDNTVKTYGSECVKKERVYRYCMSCSNYFIYYDKNTYNCMKCSNKIEKIKEKAREKYERTRNTTKCRKSNIKYDSYRDYCIAYISGKKDTVFYNYLINIVGYRKPAVNYDYIKTGPYKNCSVYHVYLYELNYQHNLSYNNKIFIEDSLNDEVIDELNKQIYFICKCCDIRQFCFNNDTLKFDTNLERCINCISSKLEYGKYKDRSFSFVRNCANDDSYVFSHLLGNKESKFTKYLLSFDEYKPVLEYYRNINAEYLQDGEYTNCNKMYLFMSINKQFINETNSDIIHECMYDICSVCNKYKYNNYDISDVCSKNGDCGVMLYGKYMNQKFKNVLVDKLYCESHFNTGLDNEFNKYLSDNCYLLSDYSRKHLADGDYKNCCVDYLVKNHIINEYVVDGQKCGVYECLDCKCRFMKFKTGDVLCDKCYNKTIGYGIYSDVSYKELLHNKIYEDYMDARNFGPMERIDDLYRNDSVKYWKRIKTHLDFDDTSDDIVCESGKYKKCIKSYKFYLNNKEILDTLYIEFNWKDYNSYLELVNIKCGVCNKLIFSKDSCVFDYGCENMEYGNREIMGKPRSVILKYMSYCQILYDGNPDEHTRIYLIKHGFTRKINDTEKKIDIVINNGTFKNCSLYSVIKSNLKLENKIKIFDSINDPSKYNFYAKIEMYMNDLVFFKEILLEFGKNNMVNERRSYFNSLGDLDFINTVHDNPVRYDMNYFSKHENLKEYMCARLHSKLFEREKTWNKSKNFIDRIYNPQINGLRYFNID